MNTEANKNGVYQEILVEGLNFDEKKAIAALTELIQIAGLKIDHYKAAKLLYLFDREMLLRTGQPAFFGKYFSLQYGPIVSEVNSGINSLNSDNLETRFDWTEYFELNNNKISIRKPGDTGLLSQEEVEILKEFYEKYRSYNFDDLKCAMHALPENLEVTEEKKAWRLSYQDVMRKNKIPEQDIVEALSEIAYEELFRVKVQNA